MPSTQSLRAQWGSARLRVSSRGEPVRCGAARASGQRAPVGVDVDVLAVAGAVGGVVALQHAWVGRPAVHQRRHVDVALDMAGWVLVGHMHVVAATTHVPKYCKLFDLKFRCR
eukprot:2556136-Prymnesium_polylepis.2